MKDEISNAGLWFKVAVGLFLAALLADMIAAHWFAEHFPAVFKR